MTRKILIPVLIAIIGAELVFFAYDQTTGIVVETPTIVDARLAAALGAARVVQISDLHITRPGRRERKLASTIERINPDIILITGDLVSGNDGIGSCRDLLRRLAVGRTVIAVLGNNDHRFREALIDTELLVRELRKAGVCVLVNGSVRLTVTAPGSVPVYVVGLDDNFTGHDDIFKALENVPADAPKILLAHSPAINEKINSAGINLILSGHTHGGQIAVPFWGALYTNPVSRSRKKYVAGLYRDGTQVYVNRGIGTVVVPLRLFSRPEVTLFHFEPGYITKGH
jgi:hypothetical protein